MIIYENLNRTKSRIYTLISSISSVVKKSNQGKAATPLKISPSIEPATPPHPPKILIFPTTPVWQFSKITQCSPTFRWGGHYGLATHALVYFARGVFPNLNYNSQVYLEQSRTSMMELFCEDSKLLLAINYFCERTPPQMFDWVLNTPLQFSIFCHHSSTYATILGSCCNFGVRMHFVSHCFNI